MANCQRLLIFIVLSIFFLPLISLAQSTTESDCMKLWTKTYSIRFNMIRQYGAFDDTEKKAFVKAMKEYFQQNCTSGSENLDNMEIEKYCNNECTKNITEKGYDCLQTCQMFAQNIEIYKDGYKSGFSKAGTTCTPKGQKKQSSLR